ncbi:hypothetical protein D3C81_1658220 [compost metagenome]
MGGGVTGLLAEEGTPRIGFAVVAQLRGGDGRPAGLFHRVEGEFFRVGIPRNAGDHPLGIGAAEQCRDQRGGQAEAEAVVLITGGKAVIEVVVGIQRDRHGIAEQRLGIGCAEVLVVIHTHCYCLSLVGIVRDSSQPGRPTGTPRSISIQHFFNAASVRAAEGCDLLTWLLKARSKDRSLVSLDSSYRITV